MRAEIDLILIGELFKYEKEYELKETDISLSPAILAYLEDSKQTVKWTL